ncbi:MAG: serine/threonine-protein kinase [Ignavibacteriae bacterium]|nr:serine/threonine-protein kinase [Ignavibacteriota bacterium]
MIGQTIINYKILSQIGEGGMGAVYLAKHATLDREVAVKVLLQQFTNNYEIKERFINEAKTLSKLSHSNIVSLYDFTEIDDNFFLIMEYIEGISLNEFISKSKDFNVLSILNIFKQILSGFEYAHSKGVIHRDIKPSNIILQTNNIPKILDFGIAKIIQGDVNLTRTGVKMGSILYMSPEQILGNEIDIRTDIYSLGILLYEMLTSKCPYDIKSNTEYEIMDTIIKQEIPLLSVNSNNEIGRIIQKACQKNLNNRYQSLSEFIYDLDNYILYLQKSDSKVNIGATKVINYIPDSSTKVLNNDLKYNSAAQSGNSHKSIIIISIVLIFITVLIFLYINSKDDNKVFQTVVKGTTNEAPIINKNVDSLEIKDKLLKVLKLTEQKNTEISNYYASNINYYKNGVASLNTLMSDKRKFFNKWDNITLSPENLSITRDDANKYVCIFDKYYKASNFSGKFYEGKVKSRLVFEKINGIWLITTETDDYIYWTKKN